MKFSVLPVGAAIPQLEGAYLVTDAWNDWYVYNTQYCLHLVESGKEPLRIGEVKIGQFGMEEDQSRPDIPNDFDSLDDRFFSLGQDDSYYEHLGKLAGEIRAGILSSLRDIVVDEEIYAKAMSERVTSESLFRSVSEFSAKGQFRRLAKGGARLTDYSFKYRYPRHQYSFESSLELEFNVVPESQPPTNVHVIIGRNGVGKTRLLTHMAQAIVQSSSESEFGDFVCSDSEQSFKGAAESFDDFANLVSVSFSAFDPFVPPSEMTGEKPRIPHSYVGLKRASDSEISGRELKSHDEISEEFVRSVQVCVSSSKVERWKIALKTLESDPIFRESQVANLAQVESFSSDHVGRLREQSFKYRAENLFNKLSSGHKIILLTITRLVEVVEEKSLVLLDEPEAYLHPPLLSAFVRSLSDLLIDRNGVAIVATHSPVVLQEVPKCCVWKLRRTGLVVNADRPEGETFGENVGVLTREVFGLEVTESGFYRMLQQQVDKDSDYDGIFTSFGGQLGSEAKAIARALLQVRKTEGGM